MSDGWRYSDGGTFRARFPEWEPISDGMFQLNVVCAELIEGRWEEFLSTPQVFFVEGEGVVIYK